MDRRQIVADLSLLFVALIWGASFIMVKEAVSQIGVFTFLTLRFLFAALVLALIFHGAGLRGALRLSTLTREARLARAFRVRPHTDRDGGRRDRHL